MTRIMDALRQAEADQQLQKAPGFLRPGLDATRKPHPPAADVDDRELVELRELLFGSVLGDIESVVERIEASLEEGVKRLREEFGACEQRLEARLAELDARRGRGQGEIRERILAESKQLNEVMDQQGQRLRELIEQGVGELRATKVDRAEFSTSLAAVANQLASGPATS